MAEEEVKTEGEAKPEPKKAGDGPSKLVPILLLVNTVLLAGVLGMLFLKLPGKHGGEKEKPAESERAPADAKPGSKADGKDTKGAPALPGPTLRLPDFVVHLRDADNERFARVSFEMEVQDEKAKEAVAARMPQIRDAFLSYLSDRTAEELRGSDAIGRVKGALTQKLAEIAPGFPVRKLYVTDLIVQ
jgi:flagellar protein FliL